MTIALIVTYFMLNIAITYYLEYEGGGYGEPSLLGLIWLMLYGVPTFIAIIFIVAIQDIVEVINDSNK